MASNKIWKIRDKDFLLSDEELIELIKQGKISKDTDVATKDMKHHVKLRDSIYSFYFKEDLDETL